MTNRPLTRICVFTGSSHGALPDYAEAARRLGALFAERSIELVYGGGQVGLMGVLADEVLTGNGRVIGVIPRALAVKEVAHAGLTELRVVETMHERKALMASLADAFIAMPGGFGTFDELFEILTWAQLGLHTKPIGLLNVAGYYDPLLAAMDNAIARAFVSPEHRALFVVEDRPAALLERLHTHAMPEVRRWIAPGDT